MSDEKEKDFTHVFRIARKFCKYQGVTYTDEAWERVTKEVEETYEKSADASFALDFIWSGKPYE